MDCLQHTALVDRQEIGVSFVYTKYFTKHRNRRLRQKSLSRQATPDNYSKVTSWNNKTTDTKFKQSVDPKNDEEPLVTLYNYLRVLFSKAKQYEVIHRCLCNVMRDRLSEDQLPKMKENRRKLSNIFEQITAISRKIELYDAHNICICQIILQRKIRMCAINFIENISLRISEESGRIELPILDGSFVAKTQSSDDSLYCGSLCRSKKTRPSNENVIYRSMTIEDCGVIQTIRSMITSARVVDSSVRQK